jgi:hypothetical protein
LSFAFQLIDPFTSKFRTKPSNSSPLALGCLVRDVFAAGVDTAGGKGEQFSLPARHDRGNTHRIEPVPVVIEKVPSE